MTNINLIEKLNRDKTLSKAEWTQIISSFNEEDRRFAADIARDIAVSRFGKDIFIRGIVEFSNFCKNDCYYCGIRAGNAQCSRYRLKSSEILDCCDEGYSYGFRTFVLQSGEDRHYTIDSLCDIVRDIKYAHPDCAVTLSIGELPPEHYKRLYNAGADRYLLRHETANEQHYEKLHPASLSWQNRMNCLQSLKEIGFQTGCGMMVGSPFQTAECLAEDMIFLHEFRPQMIGIGPFLPHKDTPFRAEPAGGYELTLLLISLCRIMLPKALIPATTALGTINPRGREEGVLSGANVIMPNLSPLAVRKKYMLYDNKICTGEESAECRSCLDARMKSIGYGIKIARGDYTEDD